MPASKLGKSMLKYLPLLAVMVLAITSTLIAKDLNHTSLDSGIKATVQLQPEQDNAPSAERGTPQILVFPEEANTCITGLIFTSLPPKCKTKEGKFIQLPGSSEVFVLPPK